MQQTAEKPEPPRDGIALTFTADGGRTSGGEVSRLEIILLLCGIKPVYMCECEAPTRTSKRICFNVLHTPPIDLQLELCGGGRQQHQEMHLH